MALPWPELLAFYEEALALETERIRRNAVAVNNAIVRAFSRR